MNSSDSLIAVVADGVPRKLQEIKWICVNAAVMRNRGDKKQAAKELGVSFKTIYNVLKAGSGREVF